MKNLFTFLVFLSTFSGVFAQTDCKVNIVFGMNKSMPPSYTFKTDPQVEGAKYSWSFGDNTYADSPSPTHFFKILDTYAVAVKVIKPDNTVCYGELKERFEGGTTTTQTTTILSGKGKVKNMTGMDGCGLVIVLDNGSVLIPVEMVTDFQLKEGQYLELAYELLNDRPTICMAGTSAKIHKISEIIVVPPVCKVPITFTKNNTRPQSYKFSAVLPNPALDGIKFNWYFGDGTSSELATPTHAFKITNSYVVNLKMVNPDGSTCSGEIKETFTGETNQAISGRGKVKKLALEGCNLVIALENGTTLVPAKMATDFQLKEGQYVELTYEKYSEKITSCKEGFDANVITIKEIPVVTTCKAYFTGTNQIWSNPTMMKKVVFSNQSTGDIRECVWNFGDNTTSTDLNPVHEYAEFGEYKVCLVISTVAGCKSDYCAAIKVIGLTSTETCNFDLVIKPKPETPNTFLFYAVSQAEIKTWSWNFGDGKTSDAKDPEHVYEKSGTYEVSCAITTSAGCTQRRAIKHTVLSAELPTCKGAISLLLFDPTDKSCNGKATVKLISDAGAEVTGVKYLWTDGRTTGTVENLCPDKQYTVQLLVEGVCQKNSSFTLMSKPVWRATTINGQNNFTVIAPVDGVNYEWNFGNGTVLTGAEVTYNFQKDGVYDVTLKAVNGTDFSEFSQQVVVLKSITGTTILNKSDLEVYPNPAKEMLKINFGNPVSSNLSLEIFDMKGQRILIQELKAEGLSHATVNIQHLKNGIYQLRILSGQNLITERKFLKN